MLSSAFSCSYIYTDHKCPSNCHLFWFYDINQWFHFHVTGSIYFCIPFLHLFLNTNKLKQLTQRGLSLQLQLQPQLKCDAISRWLLHAEIYWVFVPCTVYAALSVCCALEAVILMWYISACTSKAVFKSRDKFVFFDCVQRLKSRFLKTSLLILKLPF